MPFARPRDALLHYRFRAGDPRKRAIAFANSLGTDMRIWDAVIAALPADIPVLSYDKRGHGLSGGLATDIEASADDLGDLLDLNGVTSALVCGVSVGGQIAQSLAHRRPELTAGLILCMTAHRLGDRQGWADRIMAIEKGGLDALADAVMERWFSPSFREARPLDVEGYRTMLARTSADGYIATCRMLAETDLTQTTKRIACPTLCLAGGADQAVEMTRVQDMATLIDGASLLVMDDIGHIPSIEAPERLTALILERYEALQ